MSVRSKWMHVSITIIIHVELQEVVIQQNSWFNMQGLFEVQKLQLLIYVHGFVSCLNAFFCLIRTSKF